MVMNRPDPRLDALSPATGRLIEAALEMAVSNAGLSDDGFTPFALADSVDPSRPREGRRQLMRFDLGPDSDLTQCQAAGREELRTVDSDVTCVALAWDGYLTVDGQRSEAVFVEVYEIGQETGVRLAQAYTRSGAGLTVRGNPLVTRQTPPLVQFQRPPDPARAPHAGRPELTGREAQLLRLIAAGLPDDAIAAQLAVRQSAVRKDIRRLFMKIGVRDHAQAISYAHYNGLAG